MSGHKRRLVFEDEREYLLARALHAEKRLRAIRRTLNEVDSDDDVLMVLYKQTPVEKPEEKPVSIQGLVEAPKAPSRPQSTRGDCRAFMKEEIKKILEEDPQVKNIDAARLAKLRCRKELGMYGNFSETSLRAWVSSMKKKNGGGADEVVSDSDDED